MKRRDRLQEEAGDRINSPIRKVLENVLGKQKRIEREVFYEEEVE